MAVGVFFVVFHRKKSNEKQDKDINIIAYKNIKNNYKIYLQKNKKSNH